MKIPTRKSRKTSTLSPYFIKRLSQWLVLSTALTLAAETQAATISWDGEAADSLWGSAGNWFDTTNTVNDVAPASTDDVVFGIGGATTVNLGGNRTVNSVGFSLAGFSLGLVATTDQLTITAGNVVATTDGTINAVISAATPSLNKSGAGTLTLTGANLYAGLTGITNGTLSIASSGNLGDNSATNSLSINAGTLKATASMDLGVNRAIAVGAGGATLSAGPTNATALTVSGALSGAGALGITGGGTFILSGNNSGFSGNVNVDSVGGTANTILRLSNSNALTGGTVTLAQGTIAAGTGTSLDLAGVTIGGTTLVMNSNNAANFRSALTTSAGANFWSGGVVLNGDGLDQFNTSGAGSSLTVSGPISDGGGFTGVLFLRGVGTGTISNTITLPTGNVSKTDGGTWTISSTGNSWLNTSVAVGTLKIGATDALPTTTPVTLGQNDASTATLDLNGSSQNIASLATNPATAGANTNTKSVTNSSLTPVTLTVIGAGSGTYAGFLSGPMSILKQGGGTLALVGGVASTQTGSISITGGTLSVTADNQLGNAANSVSLNGGTFSDALTTAAVTLGATRTITVTGLTNGIDVQGVAPTGKLLLGTAGQLTGSGNFIKTGGGDLQIAVANTGYTGSPTVNGGIVEVQNAQSLGTVQPTVTIGGTGELVTSNVPWTAPIIANAGGALSGNSVAAVSYSGPITANGQFSARARFFNATATAATITLSGQITGAGGLIASGPTAGTGRVLITGSNGATWTGALQVNPLTQAVVSVGFGAGATTSLPTGDLTLNGGRLTITPSIGTGLATTAGISGRWISMGSNAIQNTFASPWFTVPTAATRTDAVVDFVNLSGINTANGLPGGVGGLPQGVGIAAPTAFVDSYAVVYNGLANIGIGGSYTFTMPSDDGSSLFIDGQEVVVNEGPHGIGTVGTGTVTLASGLHQITVKNTNGGTGGGVQVAYQGPDQAVAPAQAGAGVTNMATTGLTALTNVTGGLTYALTNTITVPNQGVATSTILETSGFDTASSGAMSVGTNGTLIFASATSHTFTQNGPVSLGAGAGLSSSSTAITVPVTTTLAPANVIVNGAVTLTGNANLNTEGGVVNGALGLLTVNGVIDDGAGTFGITKNGGGGIVTLGGTAANTFDGAFNMAQGVLLLNKTAGVNAIGAGGLNLDTSIATGTAAQDYAVVRLLANEQLADASTLNVLTHNTVGYGVTFDLNGFTETVGAVNVRGATTNMGRIVMGINGKLIVNGDIVLSDNRNAAGNTGREALITGVAPTTNALNLFQPGTGILDLNGLTRNITAQSTVTQVYTDGTIDSRIVNGGITKLGTQRLVLNGSNPNLGLNSTFAGGVTINAGLVRGGGTGARTDSAFGTGTLTINTGLTVASGGITAGLPTVELRNNTAAVNTTQGGTIGGNSLGQAVANTVLYGNAVTISAAVPEAGFDVGNYPQLQNGATLTGSGGTMVFGTLTTGAAVQIDVVSTNLNTAVIGTPATTATTNYGLRFNGFSLGGALTIKPTSGNLQLNNLGTAGANNITSAAGTTGSVIIGGSGAGYTGTINLTNGGTLRLAPAVGVANNQLGGATLTVAPTLLGISPTTEGGAISGAGAIAGGLTGKFYQTNAAQVINTSTAYNLIPSGVLTLPMLSDGGITNRPPTVTGLSFTNDIMVASGLLNILAGGSYTFQTFVDDESQLVIDGIPVVSVNAGGGGQGATHSPVSAPVVLSAGFHTITFKVSNQGGGGGYGVSYSGTDSGGLMRPIPSTALYRPALFANVANSGVNQTIAATTFTLDGGGTDLDGGINDLTFTGAGTLAVTNGASTVASPNGTGVITVSGITAGGANNITFSPSTAVLGLLGDVTGSGTITKAGAGLMILAGAKTFTGPLNITVGGVQVTDPASLGTVAGATVVSAGAVLDLNGVALGAEPLTLNGTGIASVTPAALWNSASTAASASGPVTLGAATTIGGLGDITLSGAQTGNFALTKIGPNTVTLAGASTNTAAITVSAGFLKVGNASALGTALGTTTTSGGAVLDLNGFALAEPLNLTGAGTTNYGTMNSLATLINTGAAVIHSGAIVLGGAATIGSNSLGAGGDITVSGIISAAQALTKAGGNTVTLTGVNTYSGATTVNFGTLTVSGAGIISAQSGLTVNPTATVNFDYTAAVTAKNGAHGINLVGGTLNLTGNAANTTESLAANSITATSNQSVITLTPTATGSLTLSSTNNLARGANGTILIRGNSLGSAANPNVAVVTFGGTPQTIGQFGNAGTPSRGIIPWAVMDSAAGGDGASWVNANGVIALTAAEYDTNPATINALNNLRVNAAATATAGAGPTLINSITVGVGGGTVTIGGGNSLQLDSGAIMAVASGTIGGAGAINLGIAQSNNLRELVAYTSGVGTNLTIGSTISSAVAGINAFGPNASPNIAGVGGAILRGGLTKAGLGTLTLSAAGTFAGTTRLNGGRTVLNGGANTIFFPAASAPVLGGLVSAINSQNLVVNAGATLDLNGTEQRFGGYASNLAAGSSALPGQGGVITNDSLATDATIYFTQGGSFTVPSSINQSGVVGAKKTNVVRDGGFTLTLTAPNTYTGTTVLNGGLTTLQDGATLSGTSSIAINRAALNIDDAQTIQTLNRITTATPITLKGGSLGFIGRGGGVQNAYALGDVTVAGNGAALIQQTEVGATNANTAGSTQLTIGNLIRTAVGGSVTFRNNGAQNVGDNPRFFLTQLNGAALPAPGTMLPAWVTVQSASNPASAAGGTSGTINNIVAASLDFAQYDPATGLRPVFYTSTLAPGNNVNLGATTTLPVGGAVINALRFDGASTLIFGDAGFDTLNLQSGGLLSPVNANNRAIGLTNNAGNLTAGGINPGGPRELFIYNGANTLTINARIINNPTDGSVVTPVFSATGQNASITLAGSNTYTGTTYVNGVNLNLNNTVGGLAIPGDVIAGGGTSLGTDSQSPANQTIALNASNQIAPTATVTLNGGTLLSLGANSQTLANLVFGADGGSNSNQGPSVQTGAGTLTLTGNITATNLLQASTIPAMQGNLALSAGSHTVTVGTFPGAPGETGLVINSVLSGTGSIDKGGAGALGIGGVSPGYVGAINVNTGSLMFTSNNTSVGSEVVLAAPATLNAGGFVGTVGKLSGTGTVTSIFSTLAQAGGQVNIGADGSSSSFGGLVTGAVAIGKVGAGNFFLSNNTNNYSGGTLVNGGMMTLLGLNTTGSGVVTINNTGTLAGSGAVDGGLRFNPGSSASFALPGVPGPALITTGTSGVASLGASTFNFTGSPAVGVYPLIDYGGAALTANQMAGIKIGTTPGGGLLYGLVNNAAGTSIDLSVESVHASQTWTGGVNGTWDIATTANFGGTYTDLNQVVFDNSGANKTITGGLVKPQAITVNNSGPGNDYSIANPIGGSLAGGLTKTGNGVLRLTGANTFGDSPIAITGGTVRASVSSTTNSLGSALVTLGNGTTLQLDPTANTGTVGITGRYFNQASNANTLANMHFQLPAVTTQTDVTAGVFNITWSPTARPANALVGAINGTSWESFGGQWVGKLNVTAAGPYSIFTSSDDASRVFIDGVQINNNDGGKGVTEGGATAFLGLGLHDVRFEFLQGTGGGQARLGWQGPGIAKADIPATALFAAENVSGGFADNNILVGTNVSVAGSATLALTGTNFTGVQLGGLTLPGGSTLNVTGDAGRQLRSGGTFLSGGTATVNSAVDVNPGLLTDGGVATTLVKQGGGRLVLDNTNPLGTGQTNVLTAGTVLEIQGGKLAVVGINATALPLSGTNPLGAASVRLNGGNLSLETKQGTVTFDNAITVSQSAVIEQQAASNLALTLGSATNGIAISGGSTLTFDVFGGTRGTTNQGLQNANVLTQGANLIVAGAITGTGNLAIRSTQTDFGQYPVLGNATFTANNTVAGTLTLNGGYGSQNVVTTMPLTLNSNGRLSGSTGITLNAAQLTVDDSNTVTSGRINATTAAPLTLRNGNLVMNVSTTVSGGETLAALTSDVGLNRIAMVNTPGAGITGLLTAASLTRNNRSVIQFAGSSLGGQATAASLIKFTSALVGQLVGGGGAAATSTISILPYALAASNPGTNPPTFMPVTYDATNGVRPINTTTEITTVDTAPATNNGNTRNSIGAAAAPVPTVNSVNSFVLDNSATTAQTATLTTNPLLFTNAGAGLLLLTATNGTQSALTLTGTAINFQGAEGNIIVSTTAGATISSVIQGTNGLTISGNNNINSNNIVGALWGGSLTLTADNSAGLTGTITINGRLVLNNGTGDLPLGNAANPVQFGGGTLLFNNAGTTLAATRAVTMLANSFGVIDTNGNADTIAGAIGGSGGLVKINTGTLTLSNAANNYSGTTTVLQGSLVTNTGPQGNIVLNGTNTVAGGNNTLLANVSFTQAASGTYLGNISGIGSVTINNTTAAPITITLGDPSNANVGVNTYGGGTTFANTNATTLRGTTSSLVGGIVTSANDSITLEQAFNGTAYNVISGPAPLLKLGNGAVTVVNTSSYTGTTTISAGSLIAATSSLNATAGAFGNAASAVTLGDAATTANNSSAGVFTGGAVTIGRAITVANQATTGVYTIGGAADALSTISGAISLNQSVTVSQVATTLTNSLNITGGISSANAGGKTVTFSGPGAVNVASTAIANGAGSVAVSVTGGINAFNVANTYGGATSVSNGSLLVGVAGALPVTTDLSLTGGTVDLNNAGLGSSSSQTVASLAGTGGTVTNTDPASTRTLTANQVALTAYSGLLAGNLALTKSGAGTLALSAVNSYTGGTTISGGTLNINANAALGNVSGGVALSNDATLQAAGTVTTNRTFTLSTVAGGNIDTNGQTVTLDTGSTVTGTTLEKLGTGILNIKGVQTYSALTTTGGTTNVYTAVGTGTSTVTANATLNFYASQTLASLDIGSGVEVTFGDGTPFAGEPEKPADFTAAFTPAPAGGSESSGDVSAAFTPPGGTSVTGSAVVPEPGSVGLLLVGALGLLGRRRRSRAAV